jgi:hypothetical protein
MKFTALSRALLLHALSFGAIWSNAVLAQSGDSIVDSWIGAYPQRGGNNTAPTSLQIAQYPSGWDKCNGSGAPDWEDNCPSDLTYTPGSNGGYQAYGAGHMQVPGGDQWTSYCYWVWYYDPNIDNYVWYIQCDWYYLGYYPDHSFGIAGGRIRWSQTYVNDPSGTFQLSTLALKRASVHYGYPELDCEPGFWGGPTTHVCAPWKSNVYVVPYGGHSGAGVGYEDKVLLQNAACPWWYWPRTDSATDREYGCYSGYDSDWWSDLPGAYKDNTIGDEGSDYVLGVGVSQPGNIQEGYVYGWWRVYWAWGLDSISGVSRHIGSLAYWVDAFTCDGVTWGLCMFQVDQTNIGPSTVIP